MRYKTGIVSTVIAIFAAVLSTNTAQAEYPDKPVTIVVGGAAGSGSDSLGRALAESLRKELGQNVLIENKPGASFRISAEYVKNAKPDGYTILLPGSSVFSTNPWIYPDLKYALEDFTPLTMVVTLPMVLAASTDLPVKTPAEFAKYVKENPGAVKYATMGPGTTTDLIGAMIGRGVGAKMAHVPYNGMAPAAQDVIAKRIHAFSDFPPVPLKQQEAGTMRVIGALTPERDPNIPDIPTFAESGYPDVSFVGYYALVMPKGVDAAVTERLLGAARTAIDSPEFATRMKALSLTPKSTTPEEMVSFVQQDSAFWGEIIKGLDLAK